MTTKSSLYYLRSVSYAKIQIVFTAKKTLLTNNQVVIIILSTPSCIICVKNSENNTDHVIFLSVLYLYDIHPCVVHIYTSFSNVFQEKSRR